MTSGKAQGTSRVLLAVKAVGSEFLLKSHCGLKVLYHKKYGDVREVFPGRTGEDIVRRCRDAIEGRSANEPFEACFDCTGKYSVSMTHTDGENIFFYGCKAELDVRDKAAEEDKGECLKRSGGVFIIDVLENRHFVLSYVNSQGPALMGLDCMCTNKRLEDILAREDAALMRMHLEACLADGKSLEYSYHDGKRELTVRLYPDHADEKDMRIIGTVSDTTNHMQVQVERNKDLISRKLDFEELMSKTARIFLDKGQEGFDLCMQQLLQELGRIFDAEYVCAYKYNSAVCGADFAWAAKPQWESALTAQEVYTLAEKQLRTGRMLVVSNVCKNSVEKSHKMCGLLGINSLLVIPVQRGGDIWGALCLAQFERGRDWTTAEIGSLRTVSQTIMSAYLRIKMEIQLCESNQVLVEYDEGLQELLHVEETIAKITKSFVMTDKPGFDACVDTMMSDVAHLFEADTVSVYVRGQADDAVYHNWSRRGFVKWHEKSLDAVAVMAVLTGKVTHIVAVDSFQDDYCPFPVHIRDRLMTFGIKSMLCVPLFDNEDEIGVIFICKHIGASKWSRVQISAARTLADILVSAYKKNCWRERAADKTRMARIRKKEKTDIMSGVMQFEQVAISRAQIKNRLAAMCEELGTRLGIVSLCLMCCSQNGMRNRMLLEWKASRPTRDDSKNTTKKLLCIPVVYENSVWGYLYVEFFMWTPGNHAETLRLFAQLCVRAYMHARKCSHHSDVSEGEEQSGRLLPQPATI